MLLVIIWYFFITIFGLGLGLDLQKLASASASKFWPRLTSLQHSNSVTATRTNKCTAEANGGAK